jgi:hypothetical protein
MNIVLKTREELGLGERKATAETGLAKEMFAGLSYKLNIRKDKRPSMTFYDDEGRQQTVTVEEQLEAPVRAGKITDEHLLGFTIIKGDEGGLFFLAPRLQTEGKKVDDVKIKVLTPATFNELAGY